METELITDARETEKRPEKMKYQLADALKQCMSKMPVEKITVKEIVEECGTTRQTFYRNFKDKYDLINWYFDKILLESFEHMGEGRTVFTRYLRVHLILKFYTERIEGKTGRKITEYMRFLLEMYCQGSIYMTVRWVLGKIKVTPEQMAESLVDAMPAELAELFRELELL